MNVPNSLSNTCTPVGNRSVPPLVTDQKIERGGLAYAILPREVTTDERLKHVDIRVYAVLATCRKGSHVKIGMRLIARFACISLRNVGPSLTRLADCGYLKVVSHSFRHRSEYQLTYQRFNAEAKKPAVEGKTPERELLFCPRCHRRCLQLLRVGWCRSCSFGDRIRKVVREEITRIA